MTSPYELPHLDLSRRLQAEEFTSTGSNPVGAGTPRSREQHGAKLRGELAAAYQAFDAARREDDLEDLIERLGARAAERERRLYFPEHVVLPVLAERATIELMLFARLSIVELRRASDSPVFFLDELDRDEQREVSEDLAQRTQWPGADVPAVCLLDTGVNRAHILIEPTLAEDDMAAVKPEWGIADSPQGHGTGMAGLALFGDLIPHLTGNEVTSLTHRLESVKILPPRGFDPTEERLYGAITKQAVALPETRRPNRPRVFCLAVTNDDRSGIRPTTWSSAIDQEAAGVTELDEKAPPRLFIVSAGNAPNPIAVGQIADPDDLEIEDPAQAWNAITVGGYTDLVNIHEPHFKGYSPLANAGDISPYTRTSTRWLQGKSPFKPDIVMEAGNRAVSPSRTDAYDADSLALLSTGPNTDVDPLVSFRATSAATAQAARLAARLVATFPDYWPETIRALIIHGADWTPRMTSSLKAAPPQLAVSHRPDPCSVSAECAARIMNPPRSAWTAGQARPHFAARRQRQRRTRDGPLSCRSAPGFARLEVHVLSSQARDSLVAAVNRHQQPDRSRLHGCTPRSVRIISATIARS